MGAEKKKMVEEEGDVKGENMRSGKGLDTSCNSKRDFAAAGILV